MIRKRTLLLYLILSGFFVMGFLLFATNRTQVFAETNTFKSVVQVSGDGISEANTYYLEWTNLSVVFNGESQTPTAILKCEEDEVFEKEATITIQKNGELATAIDAGDYVAVATCEGVSFSSGDKKDFTISPLSVAVQWSKAESYTYNGSAQSPTASYTNVSGQTIPLTPTGAGTEAGSHNVSVSSDAVGSNYTLTNLTCEYSISQLSVAVQWSKAEGYTYNGSAQSPTASYTNVSGQTIPLTPTGAGTEAGSHNVSVSSDAAGSNYILTNLTCEYSISPLSVAVQWSKAESYTYSGKEQGPTASYINVKGQEISLAVSGLGTDAGDHTANVLSDAAGSNYILTDLTSAYSIDKFRATILWVDFNFVENGKIQMPRAFAAGLNGAIIELPVIASGTKAGNHTAEIDVTKVNVNFDLNGDLSFSYKILQKAEFGITGTALSIVLAVLFVGAIVCIVLLVLKNKKITEHDQDNDNKRLDVLQLQVISKDNEIRELKWATQSLQGVQAENNELLKQIKAQQTQIKEIKKYCRSLEQKLREADAKTVNQAQMEAELMRLRKRVEELDETNKTLLQENDILKSNAREANYDRGYSIETYLPEIKQALMEALSVDYDSQKAELCFVMQRKQLSIIIRAIERYEAQRRN